VHDLYGALVRALAPLGLAEAERAASERADGSSAV